MNSSLSRQSSSGYSLPPKEILEIVDQPPEPLYSFSPDRSLVLQLCRPPSYPPIADFARPELKIAGIRIDPEGFCRSRMSHYTSMAIAPFTDDLRLPFKEQAVGTPISGIPEGYGINNVSWSPNGKYLAFTIRRVSNGDASITRPPAKLWLADVATGQATCLLDRDLNSIFEEYTWINDNQIIVSVVPAEYPPPPPPTPMPLGPRIEDNQDGIKSQTRTYQDLLKNEHDEHLFDYYCTTQLLSIDISSKETRTLDDGARRVYTALSPSPDGRYILLSWLERPWSYAVPCGRFPKRVQLWSAGGKLIKEIAALPLAIDIPLAFDSCRCGPRSIDWRDDTPCDVVWAEAQDGGDPAVAISPRDVVYSLNADAVAQDPDSQPTRIAATDTRYGGIAWGRGDLALLYESEWKNRRSKTWVISPDHPEKEPELLFDRNYEDSYSDPGSPVTKRLTNGRYVLAEFDKLGQLIMQGTGASPQGNKPFLDLFDLSSKEKERIWQSSPPYYEFVSSILNTTSNDNAVLQLDGLRMLARRETVDDPPQYSIMTFSNSGKSHSLSQLSNFPHPYPSLRGLQKKVLQYKRADGIGLNGTLYLPPGYDKDRDGPLPALLWAYPKEFKDAASAGQLRSSPHGFPSIGSSSPLLFLTQGFAVFDGPSMPIVAAEGEESLPNDTFVDQLVSSAEAAVEELSRQECIDIKRIAVAGHSYGAFMAAGLLAHAPSLFACGIARSGCYNRLMTPFGFQSEERTLWDAPDIYLKMSPFLHADKIEKPILFIHGEADNNPGTLLLQSERMFSAVKGHGGVTRLVVLPFESHSYSARESILHCLAETHEWLEKHCIT